MNTIKSLVGLALIILVLVVVCTPAGKSAITQAIAAPHATHSVQVHNIDPGQGLSIYGPPTLTADQINEILAAYHSPAAGTGQELYDLGRKYDIDPAFALAFFMHESNLGTKGEATKTLALGNLRCIPDRPCVDTTRGGYAQFYSWEDGYEHWYTLVSGPLYRGSGLTTVQAIIPRYAPSSDDNNEQAYISSLVYCVTSWRAGKVLL